MKSKKKKTTLIAEFLFGLRLRHQTVGRNGDRRSTQVEVQVAFVALIVVVGTTAVLLALLGAHP